MCNIFKLDSRLALDYFRLTLNPEPYHLCVLQVLAISQHRPDSLNSFFRHQSTQSTAADGTEHEAAAMVRHLVNALPWVIHSLQARTGAAELPQPFLRCLVQSCTAALAACAQAGYDEPGQHNPPFSAVPDAGTV